MTKYRVIAKMYNKKNIHGERWNEMKQFLQIKSKTWYGKTKWKTIDEEDVPSFAWIHKGCFGDETNWESKFKDIPNVKFINEPKRLNQLAQAI